MRLATPVLTAIVAAGAFAPLPAIAQDGERAGEKAGEIAEKLNDPMTQYAVAGMISAMAKAILDMPVEPLAKALKGLGDAAPDLPEDATVGDLAGTSSGEVRDEVVEHVPRAMKAMGGVAGAVEDMAPELERMARRMREALPRY